MGGFTDKPDELMTMALVRAKMCELLSCCHQDECSTSYFTVGLFSLLDSILDAPMEHILKELPLSKEVNSAILRREGNMGQVLCCVQNHELANWDEIESCCVSPQATSDAYWQAVAWAEEMKATLD
jgi:EAL and modified HD-GYP domain-containing signal transduction protein